MAQFIEQNWVGILVILAMLGMHLGGHRHGGHGGHGGHHGQGGGGGRMAGCGGAGHGAGHDDEPGHGGRPSPGAHAGQHGSADRSPEPAAPAEAAPREVRAPLPPDPHQGPQTPPAQTR